MDTPQKMQSKRPARRPVLVSEEPLLEEHLDTEDPPELPKSYELKTLPSKKPRRGLKPTIILPKLGEAIGHYEVIRELGRGGMGAVYLARDTKLGRKVAVKFLMGAHHELKQRFIQEAQAIAQCTHPNIVAIHEAATKSPYLYMVLEYLEGTTLRDLIKQVPLAPQRVAHLAIPIVQALIRAHAMGIVHRDLKPANIMLTHSGIVKVLDFGIAKILKEPATPEQSGIGVERVQAVYQTNHDALVGTVPYMAPEQLGNGDIDHRADLWSLGILLAEAVLGEHPLAPFTKAKLLEVGDLTRPMPLMSSLSPRFGKLGPVIDRCLIKPLDERIPSAEALLAELEALWPNRPAQILNHARRPYPGLAVFQEDDADRFFGRDQDIAGILARLQHTPLLTVVGPSGAGKSSLIRAGVIPALKQSGESWETRIVRPGRSPLTALANLMMGLTIHSSLSRTFSSAGRATDVRARLPVDRVMYEARLQNEPGFLGSELRAWSALTGCKILIFVDQMEELYTLTIDPIVRAQFIACLSGVADDAASPLRVILSMRADFLDRVVADRQFMTDLTQGMVLLPPMSRAGLREALEHPAELVGYRFENAALLDRMLAEFEDTPHALPLLQFTASRLWDLRDQNLHVLTHASYAKIGGVTGTLASHADAVLAGLAPQRQTVVRTIFQRLVTPTRTRDIASVDELCELPEDAEEIGATLDDLVKARLLSIEVRTDRAESMVEIVHESLIDGWPMLRRWLDEDQDNAEVLARLRMAARQWEHSGRSRGFLWRDDAAVEAQKWVQRYQKPLAQSEQHYLDAVFRLAHRTQRRTRRLVQAAFAILLAVTMVVSTLLGWAVENESRARDALIQERVAQKLAAQAAKQELLAIQKEQEALDGLKLAVKRERRAKEKALLAEKRERGAKEDAQLAEEQAIDARTAAEEARQQAILARNQAQWAAQREKLEAKNAKEARQIAERHRQQAEAYAAQEKARADRLQSRLAGQLILRLPSQERSAR